MHGKPTSTNQIMPPTPHLWIPNAAIKAANRYSSHRSEALSLYREILRTAKHFHWCDEKGIPWNIRLKEEARKEFMVAKDETDPLILARLLVTGRDCVQQVQNKFNQADQAALDLIKRDSLFIHREHVMLQIIITSIITIIDGREREFEVITTIFVSF